MICFVELSVFPSVFSGASPTTCSSTCVSRIRRDGRVEWCCKVTAPKCSATCFPCRLRAYAPAAEEAWCSGTASPIPWWILSVVLRKGKWVLLFSLPSSVGGGITLWQWHHLMHLVVQIGHFQTIFAVTANFINDAAAHNFTSHVTDKFLLKQGLTHSVLGDAAYLPADVSLTMEAILSESLLGLKCVFLLCFSFLPSSAQRVQNPDWQGEGLHEGAVLCRERTGSVWPS